MYSARGMRLAEGKTVSLVKLRVRRATKNGNDWMGDSSESLGKALKSLESLTIEAESERFYWPLSIET